MRSFTVETTTHGRVLVEDAADFLGAAAAAGLIVCFHGYGEAAEDILAQVRQIPGASRWNIASVQALNRFYTRRDEKIVANWMTRQDRDEAIEDNIAYVARVLDALASNLHASKPSRLVFIGFSQGVAMAYRAALRGRHPVAGIIALGGDIPPELKGELHREAWPKVFIGAGDSDHWYTAAKVDADDAFLTSRDVQHTVVRFSGGHEWTEEFRTVAGKWLDVLASTSPRSRSRH